MVRAGGVPVVPVDVRTANLVVFFLNTQAAAQAIVAAWYTHNVVGTFLVPLALAGAYYMVPKATGEPIHRYRWAKVRLLDVAAVRGLERRLQPDRRTGAGVDSQRCHRRDGAHAPAHVGHRDEPPRFDPPAAGGGCGTVRVSASCRWRSCCFLAAVLFMALTAFRSVNEITHFTLLTAAGAQLMMYGFVGFVFFGAIYYIVPRMLGTDGNRRR